MEDFMLHRRYCKFKKRKIKPRSKMINDDDAVTFKVKRFIKDIEKYSMLKEKKKARKEAKLLGKNLNVGANKGIYKNAVFSYPGIKALLSGSTIARLEGDLMSLSNTKSTRDKCIDKTKNAGNSKPKKTNHENNDDNDKNSNVDQLLDPVIFENLDNNEINREIDNDIVEPEIVQIRSIETESDKNNSNGKDLEGNNEADFDFMADEHREINRVEISPVADCLRNIGQNSNDEVVCPKTPSVNEDFFDIFNKTPEKRNSQAFNLFDSPVEINQWKDDRDNVMCEKKQKINELNSVGVQTSCQRMQLPEQYIFKFQPSDNSAFNNKLNLMKNDKKHFTEINSDDFDLSLKGFQNHQYHRNHQKKLKNNFQEKFTENYCFNSPEILRNRNNIHSSPIKNHYNKHCLKCNSPNISSFDLLNIKKFPKSSDDFSSANQFGKFNDLTDNNFTDLSGPKFTKFHQRLFLQAGCNFKRITSKKEELNLKRKCQRLLPNKRFKTSLKFSPHKYC